MKRNRTALVWLLLATRALQADQPLTSRGNTLWGTAPRANPADIGFTPWRVWTGLVFPGAPLPHAMGQLSPITRFGSGAGYEYENPAICAFAHSNKGHWNWCSIPILPGTGMVDPDDFAFTFNHAINHANESSHSGYYQVFLQSYNINAELTASS